MKRYRKSDLCQHEIGKTPLIKPTETLETKGGYISYLAPGHQIHHTLSLHKHPLII